MAKKTNNKHIKLRHKLVVFFLRLPVKLVLRIMYGFKGKTNKLNKDEGAFIISNHQTGIDPMFLSSTFKKPIYYVATDSVFSNKFSSWLMVRYLNPIPKKKGFSDPHCIKTMMKVAKEKGCIGLFPEGNRGYAEFQFNIDVGLAKLLKVLKLPLIIYNFHGGYGIQPRWCKGRRKGPFTGQIVQRLEVEDIAKMSNEELMDFIVKNIKIYDSDSNICYKSKTRAESLESMFFVCPKCNCKETLYSKNEFIHCKNCGLKVEYTEDLHLKSDDKDFKFTRLVEWYDYQKEYVRNYQAKDDEDVFNDVNVKLFETKINTPRKLLTNGTLRLTNKGLIFNEEIKIPLSEIIISSPAGGRKLLFSTNEKDYIMIGGDGFNPLKYALMFNQLDSYIKEKKTDQYYNL